MLGYLASTLISLSIGTLTLKLSTTLLINVGVILSCSNARNVFNEIFVLFLIWYLGNLKLCSTSAYLLNLAYKTCVYANL
jgi:hypothetical protein